MDYSVALEDNLYAAFHAFKHREPHDTQMVEKLLHLYKPPHITNVSQLARLCIEDAPLEMQLVQSGFLNQTPEELASKTIYKVLLSDCGNEFPRVNINGDQLQNNYTLTCKPGESRKKALAHIRALLKDTKDVLICDKYMMGNWDLSKKLFDFFPKQELSIYFAYELDKQYKAEIKKLLGKSKLKSLLRNPYRNLHDRYLLIDRKMEIVITSGIDYLFDDTKECTLVFRLKS